MQVTNERNNGGYITTPVILQRTPGKALKALISCEFGFGGIELSRADTSLTVRTRVMGCVDDTTEDVDLLREVLKLSSDEVLTLLELKVDEKASEEEMLGLVA